MVMERCDGAVLLPGVASCLMLLADSGSRRLLAPSYLPSADSSDSGVPCSCARMVQRHLARATA
jgi:hypothetical protein